MVVRRIIKIIALCVIFTFLLPIFKVGNTTSVKLDWFFVKLAAMMLFVFLDKLVSFKLYRQYFLILILISVSFIISNYVGGYLYTANSNFGLPIYFGIIDRVSIFVFFSYFTYKKYWSFKNLNAFASLVFLLSLLFGLSQFFDLFGLRDLALKYYLDASSVQGYNFLTFNRILGVAPAIITWGGICVLLSNYFLFVIENKIIKFSGVILAVMNVLMSGSRAAIASLVVSLVLIYLIKAVFIDNKLRSVLKVLFSLCITFLTAFLLFKTYMPFQFEFLMKRFDKAESAMTTEGRGSQLAYFKELFTNEPLGIITGTGGQAIKEYGYLEIDYAYIFVAYGFLSFVLHYSLLFLLLKQAYKFRHAKPALFLFVWGSTIGYLIFSFGFFFFKELYMGMAYWWINGMVVGHLWYLNKKQRASPSNPVVLR